MRDPFGDTDLIAAYRAGEPDAFAGIYDRYSDRVFSHLLDSGRDRADAAELTHDIFVGAARRIMGSESPDRVGPWLLRVGEDSMGLAKGDLGDLPPTEMAYAPPALRARVLSKTDGMVVAPTGVESPPPPISPYWVKMGAFALFALVIGLIGLGVSAQFQPLNPTGTGPRPPADEVPQVTSTTGSPPTTRADSPGTTASSVAASPAAVVVAPETVDLGADSNTGEITLTNAGDQGVDWALTSTTDAIVLSAAEGRIAGGETVAIQLRLDRQEVGEGDLTETLTVIWDDGESAVAVVGTNEDNPIIHDPRVTPPSVEVPGGEECANTRATVSARVSDSSELESVMVEWSPDGGGQQETEMTALGSDMYEAVVGPFTTPQTTSVRVVAVDERGNAGGASTQVTVVECP